MGKRDPGPDIPLLAVLIAPAVAWVGFRILRDGQRVLEQWSMVSAAYAGYGLAWIIAGAAMIVGGLWAVGSTGMNRVALWTGSLGSVLAGASLMIGVLTYVVPCSGPS